MRRSNTALLGQKSTVFSIQTNYSILTYLCFLSNIRWDIHLRYSSVCQIFDSELPACPSDTRSWVTYLSVKYSILNYLSAYQIFDAGLPVCIENKVLFCLGNSTNHWIRVRHQSRIKIKIWKNFKSSNVEIWKDSFVQFKSY